MLALQASRRAAVAWRSERREASQGACVPPLLPAASWHGEELQGLHVCAAKGLETSCCMGRRAVHGEDGAAPHFEVGPAPSSPLLPLPRSPHSSSPWHSSSVTSRVRGASVGRAVGAVWGWARASSRPLRASQPLQKIPDALVMPKLVQWRSLRRRSACLVRNGRLRAIAGSRRYPCSLLTSHTACLSPLQTRTVSPRAGEQVKGARASLGAHSAAPSLSSRLAIAPWSDRCCCCKIVTAALRTPPRRRCECPLACPSPLGWLGAAGCMP